MINPIRMVTAICSFPSRSYFDRALDLLGALLRLEVEPRDFVARPPRRPPAKRKRLKRMVLVGAYL